MTVEGLIKILSELHQDMPIYIEYQNIDHEIEVHAITPHEPSNLIGFIIAEKKLSSIIAGPDEVQLELPFEETESD